MKNLRLLLAVVLSLVLTAGTALAVPFPWLDYSGTIDIDGNTITQEILTTNGKYLDGTTFNAFKPDSILNQQVQFGDLQFLLSGSALSPLPSTTFSIKSMDGSTTFFSAQLSNIVYIPNSDSTGDINPSFNANLQSVVVNNTINSRWLTEIAEVAEAAQNQAATHIDLTFSSPLASFPEDGVGTINVTGKVAPVPEPGTMVLLGAGFLFLAIYAKRRKNA